MRNWHSVLTTMIHHALPITHYSLHTTHYPLPITSSPQKIDRVAYLLLSIYMFDFQNLEVYQRAKQLNKNILKFCREEKSLHFYIANQLSRASVSIVINIAEGSGKMTHKSEKNFYRIARGSVYECVSLFEIILEKRSIAQKQFDTYYNELETLSKMLFKLIQKCDRY